MHPTQAASLEEAFRERFPNSARLYERARRVFPSGVTHDARYLEPFPLSIERAAGAHKFDVDGHQLIDYWVGHGALLLGHSHPEVVAAVQAQAERATHSSASHELELAWGERVVRMVPSAERVRFTNSGSEATLMALRVARIVTGKRKVLKFRGHFHGWHDLLIPQADPPFDVAMPGITEGVLGDLVVVPPNDLEAVARAINEHDPACVIVEATGGHFGVVPVGGDFLRGLRELTADIEVPLIFDEVISGFRVDPGGAQAYYDVTPDLTTLAKILAGGLPGGCLAGRADLLDVIAFDNPHGRKMKHPGTFNGNPLSAAAGCAALDVVATGEPNRAADKTARSLRRQLNELFASEGVDWVAYGEFSGIKILPHYDGPRPDRDDFVPYGNDPERLDRQQERRLTHAFRAALLLAGVDWFGWSGMTSSAHTEDDVERTVAAYADAIGRLRAAELID